MKKLKVYLETSAWNFLFVKDAPDKKPATELLFRDIEADKHEVYISEIVTAEIPDVPAARREQLLDALRRYNPALLRADVDVDRLADAYLENGLLTRRHYRDVLHLSYASCNGMDVLLSWNMNHIVKRKTQHIVNGTNRIHGYADLEIWTPEELMDYET